MLHTIAFGLVLTSLLAIPTSVQALEVQALEVFPPSLAIDLAQGSTNTAQSNGTCYLSTQQLGVYREPNTLSEALGVLPPGAIVLLGASGQGWARLEAPVVGWMLTTGLQTNPLGQCNGLGTVISLTSTPSSFNRSLASPGFPTRDPNALILCQVTATTGLAVRNQPFLHPRTLIAILEPGQHQFQFSDRQIRLPISPTSTENRDWFYITAPVTGWISPRIVGNPTVDLVGNGCL